MTKLTNEFTPEFRPGYFGRLRDEKIARFNGRYGMGNWTLGWAFPTYLVMTDGNAALVKHEFFTFDEACRAFYEESYYRYLSLRPDDIDFICSFGECYDNAVTNVQSGLNYGYQEAFSTHIQDIAVRNVLNRMGRWFEGPKDKLLQIRSKDSAGWRFGPGNIPFFASKAIIQPSLCPTWAQKGSVEDFWQSNKFVMVKSQPISISFIVTDKEPACPEPTDSDTSPCTPPRPEDGRPGESSERS